MQPLPSANEPPGFGALLRRYRRAAGLSQEALAERAGLSARAIGALESGERVTPHHDTVRLLARALQLTVPERGRLEGAVRRRRGPLPTPFPLPPSPSLPLPLTSFIGRERELAKVKEMLQTARLVTLTGTGGCGKTRLAVQVVADLAGSYADGVALVELAGLTDPALVPHAVATALDLREQVGQSLLSTLTATLCDRRFLLLLDNCEHLLDACAHLAEALLRGCPGLRILATSREPLRTADEIRYRVPSLAVPPPNRALSLEEVRPYPAIQLFVDRARAALPTFALTLAGARSVAQICAHLDGMPLAIELAAARVEALGIEQIARRLDQRFRLLTQGSRAALPRQQTLRATIDWSYNLLTLPEQKVFARLSVFAGGWTLESAEAVCGGEGVEAVAVLDLLAQLVDRSIILAVERYGAERYRMLETLRQYATERLAEQGNAAAVHERHAGHYLARAERESGDLFVVSLAELDGLEAEHDNLRAALHWFAGHDDTERCLRLGAALQTFWYVRGYYREGQGYLTAALASDRTVSVAVRAKALVAVGWLAIWSGEHAAALVWLQEGLALYRRLGDRTGIARALLLLGWVARHQGEDAQAHLLLEQSLGISRDTSDASVISAALLNLGIIALQRHDFLRARSLLEEALALVRTLDLPWPLGSTLYHLGIVAEELGEHAHAHALYEESLRLALALGFRGLLVFILEALASLVAAQGGDAPEHRMAHALRLAAASAAEREKLGSPRTAYMPPRFERAVALARSALGAEAAAAAWAAGRAMSLEEAVAYALAEGPEAPLDGSGNPP